MPSRFPSYLLFPVLLVGCASNHVVARSGDTVRLALLAPKAQTVLLVSSRNGFAPQPASLDARGRWLASLPATQGFSYFYLVDGKIYLPDCQEREFDDFGGSNCLFQP